MNRPYRKYAIPSRDAIVTTGEMIELRPEDDRTGNARNPAPFVELTRGRVVPTLEQLTPDAGEGQNTPRRSGLRRVAGTKYVIPPSDAIVTTGEMIEFRPEDDRTGNALAHPPLVSYVWGRPVPPESNPVPPADEADRPAPPA